MSRFSLLAVTLTLICVAAANADDAVSTEVYNENASLNSVHPYMNHVPGPFATHGACCELVPHRAFALWADYCSTPRGLHGRCFGGHGFSKGCEKGCEQKSAPATKSLIQKMSYEMVVSQKGSAQKATQKHSCQKSAPAQKHCQKSAPAQKHCQKPVFQKYRGAKGCEPKCFTAPKYHCQKPTFQKYHAPKGCAQKHVAQKSCQKSSCQKSKGCAQKCGPSFHMPKFKWPHHAKCDPCGPVYKGMAPAQKYVHQKPAKVYIQKAPCHQKAMPCHQKAAKSRHGFHGLFNKPCAAPKGSAKGGKGKGGYDVYEGHGEVIEEEVDSITPPMPQGFETVNELRPISWSY